MENTNKQIVLANHHRGADKATTDQLTRTPSLLVCPVCDCTNIQIRTSVVISPIEFEKKNVLQTSIGGTQVRTRMIEKRNAPGGGDCTILTVKCHDCCNRLGPEHRVPYKLRMKNRGDCVYAEWVHEGNI